MNQPSESSDLTHLYQGLFSDLCSALETSFGVFVHSGAVDVDGQMVECEMQADLFSRQTAVTASPTTPAHLSQRLLEPTRQTEAAIALLQSGIHLVKKTNSAGITYRA